MKYTLRTKSGTLIRFIDAKNRADAIDQLTEQEFIDAQNKHLILYEVQEVEILRYNV